MKTHKISILAILASLLLAGYVFAQDNPQGNTAQLTTKDIVVPQNMNTTQPPAEPETQWIWGEVVSADSASKSVTIKYLDYETDQEKDMVIGVDEKTTYENIKSIDDIKPKDTLSIDYIAGPDGKNVAKNISLEKPESVPAPQEAAPSEETSPENMQPAPAAGTGQQ